jgi:hypothetical protein
MSEKKLLKFKKLATCKVKRENFSPLHFGLVCSEVVGYRRRLALSEDRTRWVRKLPHNSGPKYQSATRNRLPHSWRQMRATASPSVWQQEASPRRKRLSQSERAHARCLANTATTILRASSRTNFCSSAEISMKPSPRSRKIHYSTITTIKETPPTCCSLIEPSRGRSIAGRLKGAVPIAADYPDTSR